MNRIELIVQRGQEVDVDVVRILVDDSDLIDLARRVERPFANAEGHPDIAGGYDGLMPSEWLALPERYSTDDRVAVLACACGEIGCWPLRVRVVIEDDRVTWTDFQQPYRESWDLSTLGPFVFDRAQYDREVMRIQALARQADA